MNSHQKEKNFQCKECGKEFHLKWRLNKHLAGHKTSERFCHFFNNEKDCPYAEIGCMFIHTESPNCMYQDKCLNPMCQYRHNKILDDKNKTINEVGDNDDQNDSSDKVGDDKNKTIDEVTDNEEQNDNVENDYEEKSSENEEDDDRACEICDKMFKTIPELVKHWHE
jgi:Ran GTPase-activating protein (RanGAP) involved in mRNA processing and transport